MAVIDELILRKGTTRYPIDSYDNKMIDEIVYEGQKFHFAKQKDLTGTSEIVADNGVAEPIISLGVSGATSQVLLPTEYQQVEYIESNGSDTYSGTQYIDTGYKPNQNTKAEVKCQYRYPAQSVFGANPYFVLTTGSSKYRFRYNSTAIDTTVSALDLVILTLDRNVAYLNGELIGTFTEATFQSPHNALLFARNNASGVAEERAKVRVYYAKIWDDGVLVRNFIPCYRKADNVIGMYDLINNVFYTNSGTGTFLKGADYNQTPTPEAPIPIQNANDNGMSVVVHGTNLATAYQIFADRNKYTELEFDGRECIRYQCDKATNKVIEGGFKENTQYTLSCEAYATVRTGSGGDAGYLYIIYYTDGTYNSVYLNTVNTWEYSKFTTKANKTVATISMRAWSYMKDVYVDVNTFQINEGTQVLPYEPYFRETVEIPTSVGTLSTALTEYDKLTVDRLNNKVVYTNGSHTYKYKGTEYIEIDAWASGLGYGNYYRTYVTTAFDLTNVIACTHFKKGIWTQSVTMKTQMNVVCPASNYLFFFKTDGVQTLGEFKAFLAEQYANGTPVTLLTKRKTPIEHDITNTDLGQSLLALATRKGTNYLEISSNLVPSQTDLSYWRQIIPGE